MIANPPHIIELLRTWQALARIEPLLEYQQVAALAALMQRFIGHQTRQAFLATYQLYLQSIPFPIASNAWGLNAAEASAATHLQH